MRIKLVGDNGKTVGEQERTTETLNDTVGQEIVSVILALGETAEKRSNSENQETNVEHTAANGRKRKNPDEESV